MSDGPYLFATGPRGATTRPNAYRLALPILLIVPLLWLMVGCVYLPWFEQADLTGIKRDFRPLVGNRIAVGRITKEQVVRVLGEPRFRSPNDLAWAYTLSRSQGIWVEPLCLNAAAGGRRVYALGLRFDEVGVLKQEHLVSEGLPVGFRFTQDIIGGSFQFARYAAEAKALFQIDRDDGVRVTNPSDPYGPPILSGLRNGYDLSGFSPRRAVVPPSSQPFR